MASAAITPPIDVAVITPGVQIVSVIGSEVVDGAPDVAEVRRIEIPLDQRADLKCDGFRDHGGTCAVAGFEARQLDRATFKRRDQYSSSLSDVQGIPAAVGSFPTEHVEVTQASVFRKHQPCAGCGRGLDRDQEFDGFSRFRGESLRRDLDRDVLGHGGLTTSLRKSRVRRSPGTCRRQESSRSQVP